MENCAYLRKNPGYAPVFINDSQGGFCYKPRGFLRSPRHYCKFYYSSFYFNKANK